MTVRELAQTELDKIREALAELDKEKLRLEGRAAGIVALFQSLVTASEKEETKKKELEATLAELEKAQEANIKAVSEVEVDLPRDSEVKED